MQLNKRWACVVFLSLLFPVTAYSQTSLYELPQAGWLSDLALLG